MKDILTALSLAAIDAGNIPCSGENPGDPNYCPPDGSGIVSTIIVWSYVLIAVVAVIVLIIAGVQYITSEGEPEKTKRAQATITYTIIGLIIATAAAAIISFVTGAFS